MINTLKSKASTGTCCTMQAARAAAHHDLFGFNADAGEEKKKEKKS